MAHRQFAIYREARRAQLTWWLVLQEHGPDGPIARRAWAFDRPLSDPERLLSREATWDERNRIAALGVDTLTVSRMDGEVTLIDRGDVARIMERGGTEQLAFHGVQFRGTFNFATRGGDTVAEIGWAVEMPEPSMPAPETAAADSGMSLVKSDAFPERYVLGIVAEPEVEDSWGHVASAEVIRKAAHYFMENGGRIGENHVRLVPDGVKILETFLAPVGYTIETGGGPVFIKAGTWLLATRIVDDVLWQKILSGELTGYSYSGLGRLVEAAQAA